MSKVYGLADLVIVELGNDTCNANAAFALLTQLAALSPDQWEKVMTQQKGSSEAGLPPLGASSWDSLASFCSSRWFTRLWVVQEFALGKPSL
jgi:Heterokaryon incompatibility protein (HET)